MTAAELAAALGGRRTGSTWMCRCPAHEDRTPSLAVREVGDRVLVRCHAGCDQRTVLAALRERGLWPDRDVEVRPLQHRRPPPAPGPSKDDRLRTDLALAIWKASVPAGGTIVETYLRSRGIELAVPPSLRFHANLTHAPTGLHLPAMVAAVQSGNGQIVAVHRTFLDPARAAKAGVTPAKLALGPLGDGAVRLGPAGEEVGIAEGIETALSAMELFRVPCWAALGSRLHAIALPQFVRRVHIFADNGGPGIAAANRAIEAFTRQGRRVAPRFPKRQYGDFNDGLMALRQGAAA